jgi:DNA-binding Lrp family transcriptional regulator
MNDFERQLLDRLQRGVPLVREPYAMLASEMGALESDVLEQVRRLRTSGVLREISGIFDAAALGYSQALVAFAVAPEKLEAAAAHVAAHPGVSHCYSRANPSDLVNPFNLWFTLAVSPRSAFGLDGTTERRAREAGAEFLVLPMVRKYKLDTRSILAEEPTAEEESEAAPRPAGAAAGLNLSKKLSVEQIRALRAIQTDLPAHRDPFLPIAHAQSLDADSLLVHAADFLAAGCLRRYAAVLHHRAAGAAANLLVAWRVSEAAADAAGLKCARFPAVSHCYLRPAFPAWPYNLYTMIHGRTREDCEITIEEIVAVTALRNPVRLWTEKEYKKSRVQFFNEREGEWEKNPPI